MRFSYWQENTLVLESTLDGGLHITQAYYVDDDGYLVQDIEFYQPSLGEPKLLKRRFRQTEND